MPDERVWDHLHELANHQFGLFTAAQARKHGIARYQLARRTDAGQLYRAHHGIYGFTSNNANMLPYEDWAAQWLALRPDDDINTRRAAPESIISHASAAVIRNLGTITAGGLFLTSPRRINTRNPRVFTTKRDIGARGTDWDLVDGLPVATPARIIADLARDNLDGSHQGTVIADTLDDSLATLDEIGARLNPYAHRWDEPDGTALALRFMHAAGRRALPA